MVRVVAIHNVPEVIFFKFLGRIKAPSLRDIFPVMPAKAKNGPNHVAVKFIAAIGRYVA